MVFKSSMFMTVNANEARLSTDHGMSTRALATYKIWPVLELKLFKYKSSFENVIYTRVANFNN
jgi:hypothetical protein